MLGLQQSVTPGSRAQASREPLSCRLRGRQEQQCQGRLWRAESVMPNSRLEARRGPGVVCPVLT